FLLDHLHWYFPFGEFFLQCRRCHVPVPEQDFFPRVIFLPRPCIVSVPVGIYTVPTVTGLVGVENSPRSTASDALLISLIVGPAMTAIAMSCFPGPSPVGWLIQL
ncbi:MAG: uncharacterized protein A8A55_2808, partial [Amphiamblys sp. WSBS2006]